MFEQGSKLTSIEPTVSDNPRAVLFRTSSSRNSGRGSSEQRGSAKDLIYCWSFIRTHVVVTQELSGPDRSDQQLERKVIESSASIGQWREGDAPKSGGWTLYLGVPLVDWVPFGSGCGRDSKRFRDWKTLGPSERSNNTHLRSPVSAHVELTHLAEPKLNTTSFPPSWLSVRNFLPQESEVLIIS